MPFWCLGTPYDDDGHFDEPGVERRRIATDARQLGCQRCSISPKFGASRGREACEAPVADHAADETFGDFVRGRFSPGRMIEMRRRAAPEIEPWQGRLEDHRRVDQLRVPLSERERDVTSVAVAEQHRGPATEEVAQIGHVVINPCCGRLHVARGGVASSVVQEDVAGRNETGPELGEARMPVHRPVDAYDERSARTAVGPHLFDEKPTGGRGLEAGRHCWVAVPTR